LKNLTVSRPALKEILKEVFRWKEHDTIVNLEHQELRKHE
jgi:hypothetical protein